MKDCSAWRRLAAEDRYDELGADERSSLIQHLEICPDCRLEVDSFHRLFELLEEYPRSELEGEFWEKTWEAVRQRTRRPTAGTFANRVMPAAAALLILLAGVGVGRYWGSSVEPFPARAPAETSSSDALLADLNRYLVRSNVLLMGFANLDPDQDAEALDFSTQKAVSQELLVQGAILRQELEKADLTQLAGLVAEVDDHLLLILRGEGDRGQWLRGLKSGIENRALLYRINLEEMRLSSRNREKAVSQM